MKNSVYILWLEGVNPVSLNAIPALGMLKERGMALRLTPLPLVEKGQCYYQTLTGMGAGKTGYFDAVRPEGYHAQPNTDIPDGVLGQTLPDILRRRNLKVISLETDNRETLEILNEQMLDCALIRFLNAGSLAPAELEAVVRRFLELAKSATHTFVLTDVWQEAARTEVNVNNFLAEVGLLELDTVREKQAIKWDDTLAYGIGTGQIWVNLRGREPQGVVMSGVEYQDVCDALQLQLSTAWLDPETQEPVVERVFKKEEIYSGEYLFKAPDLIIVYRPGYVASEKAFILELDKAATHVVRDIERVRASYAYLLGSGPALAEGFNGEATLVDFLPNILYLLGVPIPRAVDGDVIAAMFTQEYRSQVAVARADSDTDQLSDEEEGLIVDRLRDLGYLG